MFKKASDMEDSIFYHEDFYKQIELIPEQNYFKALKDIDSNSIDYEPEHGFISAIERKEQNRKTEDLNIQISLIIEKLEKFIIKRYDIVKTGYGNTIKIKENTIALGFERLALFFELNKIKVIKNIWLCQSIDLPKTSISDNLLNALFLLGKDFNFILVDWNEEIAVRLRSNDAIKTYLKDTFSFNFLPQ